MESGPFFRRADDAERREERKDAEACTLLANRSADPGARTHMFTARAPPVEAAGSGEEDRHGTELYLIHSGCRRKASRRLLVSSGKVFIPRSSSGFCILSVSDFALCNVYEVFRPRCARRAVFCARLRDENKQTDKRRSLPVGYERSVYLSYTLNILPYLGD